MDFSKLSKLRQIAIAKPCPEDWDRMAGDDQRRFCTGCGCHVHNIAEYDADEAEQLLAQPGRVCTRIVTDAQKGILTRSGWIPRLALTGAVVAAANGCTLGYSPSARKPQPEKKAAQLAVPSVIQPSSSVVSIGVVPISSWYDDSKPLTTTGVRIIVQESDKKKL